MNDHTTIDSQKLTHSMRHLLLNMTHPKDSFLRALREVAPEMELENHGQYIKKFVMKLIYIQSYTFRHFTKKLYLEE